MKGNYWCSLIFDILYFWENKIIWCKPIVGTAYVLLNLMTIECLIFRHYKFCERSKEFEVDKIPYFHVLVESLITVTDLQKKKLVC